MNLKQLKELEAKATQGKWESCGTFIAVEFARMPIKVCDGLNKQEGELICLLRNNAKEIVRMMEELEELRIDAQCGNISYKQARTLIEALEWMTQQENLTFAECELADEWVLKARNALNSLTPTTND